MAFIRINYAPEALYLYNQFGLQWAIEYLEENKNDLDSVDWNDVVSKLEQEYPFVPDDTQLKLVINYLEDDSNSNAMKALAYEIVKNLLAYEADDDPSGKEIFQLMELGLIPEEDIRLKTVRSLINHTFLDIDASDYITLMANVTFHVVFLEDENFPRLDVKVDVDEDTITMLLPLPSDCEKTLALYNKEHNEHLEIRKKSPCFLNDNDECHAFLCKVLENKAATFENLGVIIADFVEAWMTVRMASSTAA